jgi:Protein of unknown function (DUF4232)
MENTQAVKIAATLCIALVVAGCGSTNTVTTTQTVTKTVTKTVSATQCPGSDVTATFDVVPGSAGAGNIVYALKLTNSSSSPCELALTGFQLLDANGNDVPTNVTAPTATTLLAASESLGYHARFSPDVNGTGDNTNGQCQPTSATLRITLAGGGTVDAPIKPPTPVCEKGSMSLTSG